ncbi:MAG: hypothetical protein R2754_09965 [Microthrixaceae bacterium]
MSANFDDTRSNHPNAEDPVRELLGAYALDAVDADERLAVEELLERSPDARAELATLQVAVDALAAEAATAPPIGTWQRLQDRLAVADGGQDDASGSPSAPPAESVLPSGSLRRRVAPAEPTERADRPTPRPEGSAEDSGMSGAPGLRAATPKPETAPAAAAGQADPGRSTTASEHPAAAQHTADPAGDDELGRRRRRRAASGGTARPGGVRPWPLLAAAAAVVAALAVGGLMVRQGNRIDDLTSELAAGGLERSAQAALADPSTELVDLAGSDLLINVRAAVTENGTGYLFAEDLPELPDDQTYQLWAAREDKVISVGVLGPRPTVSAFHTDPGVKALAITVETSGGVVRSGHDPVAAGEFS